MATKKSEKRLPGFFDDYGGAGIVVKGKKASTKKPTKPTKKKK